jgi:nucleoside-diphosphate-sugar epimerase
LAWWLRRISEGGEVLAPGPQDLALQYIDARDLAKWMVASAEKQTVGIYNALSPRAHSTISELLELCKATTNSAANFTWVPSEFILEHGIQPWTEMPIWISPDMYGFYGFDTSKAQAAGLTCRPISETVADTWTSILSEAQSVLPPGRIPPGVPKEKELEVLATWASRVR